MFHNNEDNFSDFKSEAKETIKTELHQQGLAILKKYPHAELYRLIVDGQHHQKQMGWVGYESREAGCLKAVFNGLETVISNLEEKVTLELICQLHADCASGVKNLPKDIAPGNIRQFSKGQNEIRCNVAISSPKASLTEKGANDLLSWLKKESSKGSWNKDEEPLIAMQTAFEMNKVSYDIETKSLLSLIQFAQSIPNATFHFYSPAGGPHIKKKLEDLIKNYNEQIEIPSINNDQKIKIMVDFIWELEHLHAFIDCNTRTHVILLLNRLLIQHGMPPATYENPNLFFICSREEMVEVVKNGIQQTLDIIEEKPAFNFNSETILPKYQAQYVEIIRSFVMTLHNEEDLKRECISQLTNQVKMLQQTKQKFTLMGKSNNFKCLAIGELIEILQDNKQEFTNPDYAKVFKETNSNLKVIVDDFCQFGVKKLEILNNKTPPKTHHWNPFRH